MTQRRFPPGWTEKRVRRVLAHYADQSEAEAVVEDEAAEPTMMAVPRELVPVVRELVAARTSAHLRSVATACILKVDTGAAMKTKVQKWGNSLALRIPKSFAIESRMAEGTVVDVSVQAGELVVVAVADKEYALDELLAGVTKRNRHEALEFGAPVGKEAL